jgi:hypothetical protein
MLFQQDEGCLSGVTPLECFMFQQRHEGCSHLTKAHNELVIVASEAEEAPLCPQGTGPRLSLPCCDLRRIHGHPGH